MKVLAVHEYLLFKEAVNPFLKLKSDGGIVLLPGYSKTEETGEIEALDQLIGFGLVEAVGDECKYVKPGDGIFYDRRSIRAVPLKDTLWQYQERNIIAVIPQEDEILQKAYKEYYKVKSEIDAQEKAYQLEQKEKRQEEVRQYNENVATGKIKEPKLAPLIKINHDK